MTVTDYCPVCGKRRRLTRHHIFRSAVWRDFPETQSYILLVCRQCHDKIEREVTIRENIILQKYPELYVEVVEDFTGRDYGSIKRLYCKIRDKISNNVR